MEVDDRQTDEESGDEAARERDAEAGTDVEAATDDDATGDDEGPGLTDEARSRGGRNSSQEQERDEQGRFIGKD